MKYVCIGYYAEENWNSMSEVEQEAFIEKATEFDNFLKENGHFIRGEALQEAHSARTLRFRGGKVIVTDGPYAETKEQIGGLLLLEAESLDQAVELMSRHPGVRMGPFEIRPTAEECNVMSTEKPTANSQ